MSGRGLAAASALGLAAAVLAWAGVAVLSPWVLLAWPAVWLALLVVWLRRPTEPACRVCACTDNDCADQHNTGEPCTWVGPDLCSACTSPLPVLDLAPHLLEGPPR